MKVEILPGCIGCGACSSIDSDVFELSDVAHVHQENVAGHEEACRTAAQACPVDVIKIIED